MRRLTNWIAYFLVIFGTGLGTLESAGSLSPNNTNTAENPSPSLAQVTQPRCQDKYARLINHTACLVRSPNSQPIDVTADVIELIVDKHNRHRSDVSPPAANMLKMSWDDEIAMIAQAWANDCSLTHDEPHNRDIPGRLSLGQNVGNGFQSWTGVIYSWFDQSYHFTYGGDDNDFGRTGMYTQAVWADTNKIGCGASRCGDVIFYVCNYGPAGNIEPVNKPYKNGTSCSDCPNHCKNKLCDCGNNVCENGGQMIRSSCQCRCEHYWLIAPQCKLNCSAVTEPFYCGTGSFDREGCTEYENVPHDCPNTCEKCPYGDFKYVEGSYPLFPSTTATTIPTTTTTTSPTTTAGNGNNNGSSQGQGGEVDISSGPSVHGRRGQLLSLVGMYVLELLLFSLVVWAPRRPSSVIFFQA